MEIVKSSVLASEVSKIARPAVITQTQHGIDNEVLEDDNNSNLLTKGLNSNSIDDVLLSQHVTQLLGEESEQHLAAFLSDAKNILTDNFIEYSDAESFVESSGVESSISTKEPYGLSSSQVELLKSL